MMADRSSVPVVGMLGPLYLLIDHLVEYLKLWRFFCEVWVKPEERRSTGDGALGPSGTEAAHDDDRRDEEDQEDAHSQNDNHDDLEVNVALLAREPPVADAFHLVGDGVEDAAAIAVAFLAILALSYTFKR